MAKQTFTTGQLLTAAQMTSLQQTAMLGGAASAKTASYTLVAADAGTAISMSSASATTITVNTALFAAGDTVQITNLGVGVCTITAGTATVNSSASLALAQYESGTLDFTSASAAIFIKGAGAAAASGGMTLLSTTSLTGNSVTISSISGSHKILYLVGRNIVSSANENVQIRFNSDSGSNYAWTRIRVTGTADTYTNATGNTSIDLMEDFTNTDFNRAGFFQFTIPRYSETEIKAFYFNSLGSTSTQRKVDWVQGTYNSTSAISSITILNEAGGTNFSSGTVYVYGVS